MSTEVLPEPATAKCGCQLKECICGARPNLKLDLRKAAESFAEAKADVDAIADQYRSAINGPQLKEQAAREAYATKLAEHIIAKRPAGGWGLPESVKVVDSCSHGQYSDPPLDIDAISRELRTGRVWSVWLDDVVVEGLRTLHGPRQS